MKNVFLGVAVGFSLIFLIAFKNVNYEDKSNSAEVDQLQGYYLFVNAKPVKEYKYLGTVKYNYVGCAQYQDVRDWLIKKIKKEFPEANGIIFTFSNGSADQADGVKFK